MASRSLIGLFVAMAALAALSSCSGARKMRLAERDKLSHSTGMYCDFVNGDEFQDVDVELNLQMARRCDSSKSFTVSGYKNSSDVYGLVYCCSLARKEERRLELRAEPKKEIKSEMKRPEKAEPAKTEAKAEPPKAEVPRQQMVQEMPKAEEPLEVPKPEVPEIAPEAPAAEAPKAPSASKPRPAPRRAPASQKFDSSDLDAILEN